MYLIEISRKVFLNGLSKDDLYYALGRFYIARKIYRFFQIILSFFKKFSTTQTTIQYTLFNTVFPEVCIDHSIAALRQNSVSLNLTLPSDLVDELREYAHSTSCLRSGDRKPFIFSEVQAGKLADGVPVVLGFVDNPMACPAVKKICADATLLAIVKKHLGYFPEIEPRLLWSFVNEGLTDAYRIDHWQTVKYHFDVDGYNFIYANFYLSSVNAQSGAHVMIKGSHKGKPLKMLFHSAVQSDEAILNYFGNEKQLIIEGEPGFGFIQDSACYHKALAPIKENRLMLQLRFS